MGNSPPPAEGAYAYNGVAASCGQFSPCNACLCFAPMWHPNSGCCCDCGDGKRFKADSPHWGAAGAPVRAQFERELRGPAMQHALADAPKVFVVQCSTFLDVELLSHR